MKAAVLEQFNEPLVIKEWDKPGLHSNEVLVQIKASGLNPLDKKILQGLAAHAQVKLPAIPGIDMAGVVVATGEEVQLFKPGDEVYGMVGGVGGLQGTLAEYIAVDANTITLKPANLSFREAAALPLITITAWEALVDKANIQAGQMVLIHGGAGGVGHIAVQLAKSIGALVFTTVSDENSALIKSYGAVPVPYTRLSVEQYVNEFTGGKGFDVVLDTIGGQVLDDSFKAVKRYTGHAVSILGWGTHSLAPLSFRSGSYSGVFTLYPLLSGEGRKHQSDILREAAQLVEAGKLRPHISNHVYTLEQANEAFAQMDNRTTPGKIVIETSGS